jgi:Tfp pilus assembly protein PilN
MRAVNLLPRETKRTSGAAGRNVRAIVALAAGAVVVAALSGGYLFENSKVAGARRGLDAAKAELAATPVPPAGTRVTTTPAAVASARQPLLQAVSSALSQRIAWDRILREFSLVMPSDVRLTSLMLTAPAAGATTNTGVQLVGATYSYDGVARLLSRLSLVPDLTSVALASSTRTAQVIQFTVNAAVKGAPAPVAPVPPATTTATTTGASS